MSQQTNSSLLIDLIRMAATNEFRREDVMNAEDVKRLSPYITNAVRAGIIDKRKRGVYVKTELLDRPNIELEDLMRQAEKLSRNAPRSEPSVLKIKVEREPEYCEHDMLDLIDQLSVESIFDVLAAKFNIASNSLPALQREIANLRDQIGLKEDKIRSLQTDISRLEEKQRVLNAENVRLTALMANGRQDRLVLAKPINASGTAVFKDATGERPKIRVYRKA